MKSTLLVLKLIFAAVAVRAYAEAGAPLWTNRYNSLGHVSAKAYAIAVSTTNVYVTGTVYNGIVSSGGSDFDYATVAYSSAGVPLWTNFYNGPANGEDEANAIAVDRDENVIVTGASYSAPYVAAGYPVFATIKYSPAGVPIWTNRFSGSDSNAAAFALAVAGNGNIYVTGSINPFQSFARYATVAYSSAGTPLWTNFFNGGGSSDNATAIAADSAGNVFVTGQSISGGGQKYATVAYSSAGTPLWTLRYFGLGFGGHYPHAIATDGSGHVFVTGQSFGVSYDYATIAYDTAGTPLWTNRYNGPGNGNDYSEAVVADSAGNVFVTGGETGAGSGLDFSTIKYSNAGIPLWTNRYNGPGNGDDLARAIAVDRSGSVFVTGYSTNSMSGNDYVTIAYSAAGVGLWTNRYNGPGNGNDLARAIAVDSIGSVFVTGYAAGTNGYPDYTTIKYSSSPPLPRLDSQNLDNQLVLSWTNAAFGLQAAPAITGPFTNLPGATSPYTNPINGAQQFFRLISN